MVDCDKCNDTGLIKNGPESNWALCPNDCPIEGTLAHALAELRRACQDFWREVRREFRL